MSDNHSSPSISDRRCRAPALLPALLFSLALHIAAVSMLFSPRQPLLLEPSLLTLRLQPVASAVQVNMSPQVEPGPLRRGADPLPLPAAPLSRVTAFVPVTVERAETFQPVPLSVSGTGETTTVAKASTVANAPGRSDIIEPPRFDVAYLNNLLRSYPPLARARGLEGRVVLRVRVSAQGTPEQIAVGQSSGVAVLDEAAIKSVRGWTFVPARRGEVPIAQPLDVPIVFQLKNWSGDRTPEQKKAGS